MWLLETTTLELHEFIGNAVPPYAILSHVWGQDEVTFVDMRKPKHREAAKKKTGYAKVEGCCVQALKDGYRWVWIDSCCIDKRSSAELSEAINSMWTWYTDSARCYVYLFDVASSPNARQELRSSRWLSRGWTLQELLAPVHSVFFTRTWTPIGKLQRHPVQVTSSTCPVITDDVSAATGIPADILSGRRSVSSACVAQRMSWASCRVTTRPEDRAYSLMGLFKVNMPILYGEGLCSAFDRLQRAIMSNTDDQSIWAWHRTDAVCFGLLATSPDDFSNSGSVESNEVHQASRAPFSITNIGLRITLQISGLNPRSRCFIPNTALEDDETEIKVLLRCCLATDRYSAVRLTLWHDADDPDGCPIFLCKRLPAWDLEKLDLVYPEFQTMYINYD
jgi:hypothetical protein